jgi:formylglycine-generating enzyme required for sulfatase activity
MLQNIRAVKAASMFVIGTVLCAIASQFAVGNEALRGKAESGVAEHAGDRFHDTLANGKAGPELVVVPGGSFQMGSPTSEADRNNNEGPVHEVRPKAFGLGRTEITRGEFAQFVQATGYKTDAERNTNAPDKTGMDGCFVIDKDFKSGWKAGTSWRDPLYAQTEAHPAVCISWNDAHAYAEWLTRETGQKYRLPSEAEMEYAIRAGTQTSWPWGNNPNGGCATSNGADVTFLKGLGNPWALAIGKPVAASTCEDGFVHTAPVASLKSNAFGLYDMVGNVYEWAQDCYHEDYNGAPSDGSVFAGGNCAAHFIRAGSFTDEPAYLRSAVRIGTRTAYRYHNFGMRVARDLNSTDSLESIPFKFKGATEDASAKSLEIMLSKLSAEKRLEFLSAIKRIQFDSLRRDKPIPLGPRLDGMTIEDILTFSQTLPSLPEPGVAH